MAIGSVHIVKITYKIEKLKYRLVYYTRDQIYILYAPVVMNNKFLSAYIRFKMILELKKYKLNYILYY